MKAVVHATLPLAGACLLALAVALLPWERLGAPLVLACVLGAGAWALIARVERGEGRRRALVLFFVSLGLRLGAAWVYRVWMGERAWLDDAVAYDRVGWALAQSWRSGTAMQGMAGLEWVAGEPFARIVAALYWLVGHSPRAVIVLNGLLGSASAYLTYRLGADFLGEEAGWLAGWMAALYTGFWVFSLMPLKDALVVAATLCFFLALHRLLSNRPSAPRLLGWTAVAVASGAIIVVMRDYVFIAAGLGALAVLLVRAAQVPRMRWLALAAVVVLGVAAVALGRRLAGVTLPLGNFGGDSPLARWFGDMPSTATLPELALWAASHPLSFVAFFGLALISTLLAPYAWILPGAIPDAAAFGPYTVGFPGMWLWYAVFPFAVLGLWPTLRRSRGMAAGLMLYAALLLVLFSLTIPRESRHRDLLMPVLLMLSAGGIAHAWRRRRLAWLLWIPLLGSAVIKLQAWLPLAAAMVAAGLTAGVIFLSSRRWRLAVRRPFQTKA